MEARALERVKGLLAQSHQRTSDFLHEVSQHTCTSEIACVESLNAVASPAMSFNMLQPLTFQHCSLQECHGVICDIWQSTMRDGSGWLLSSPLALEYACIKHTQYVKRLRAPIWLKAAFPKAASSEIDTNL